MQLSDTALTAQMAVPSLAYAFPHSLEVNWAQYDTVDAVVVAVPLPEELSVSELVPDVESSSESFPESSSSLSPLVLESSSESSPLVLLSSSESPEVLESSSSESSESPVALMLSSSESSSSLSSLSPVTSIESESPSVESPLSVVAELSVSVWPKTVTMNSSNNNNLIRRNILNKEVWSSYYCLD